MKNSWILAVIPTTWAALNVFKSPDLGSGGICISPNCKQPPTLPFTISSAANFLSPLYQQVIPITYEEYYGVKLDNICATFYKQKNQFLLYVSAVTEDGKIIIYNQLEVDFLGRPGVIVGADPTCTFQDFAIEIECGPIIITYICFKFGECNEIFTPYAPGYDTFHGISFVSKVPYECQLKAIAQIYATPGFNPTKMVPLPNRLNNKCVACVDGVKCLGYDKLDKNNSISIYTQSSQASLADYQLQFLQLFGNGTNIASINNCMP